MASVSWGFVPAPSKSTHAIEQNFLDVAQEIERRDLTKGGTVNANLSHSSATVTTGNALFKSSLTVNGPFRGKDASAFEASLTSLGTATYTTEALFKSTVTSEDILVHGAGPIQASSGCTVAVNALSVDGAAVSTGSIVKIGLGSIGHTSYLTFTTTTTASVTGPLGIITESPCPTNVVCPVCVAGLVRVRCDNGTTVGYKLTTGSTRGTANHASAPATNGFGQYMDNQTSGAAGWCTAVLGWGGP